MVGPGRGHRCLPPGAIWTSRLTYPCLSCKRVLVQRGQCGERQATFRAEWSLNPREVSCFRGMASPMAPGGRHRCPRARADQPTHRCRLLTRHLVARVLPSQRDEPLLRRDGEFTPAPGGGFQLDQILLLCAWLLHDRGHLPLDADPLIAPRSRRGRFDELDELPPLITHQTSPVMVDTSGHSA